MAEPPTITFGFGGGGSSGGGGFSFGGGGGGGFSFGGGGGGFSFGGPSPADSGAPPPPTMPPPADEVNSLRAIVHTARRGDLFVTPGGGVGKHISTGGRAPRKMMAASKSGKSAMGGGMFGGGAPAEVEPAPTESPEATAAREAEVARLARVRAANDALQRACANEAAVTSGDGVAAALADPDADPGADGGMALRLAGAHGRPAAVTALLACPRFDPAAVPAENTDGGSGAGVPVGTLALAVAAYWGHASAVAPLLADPRVDPSGDGNFPLEMAAERGHADVVTALLACPRLRLGGAAAPQPRPWGGVPDGGARALVAAALYGHAAVLDALLADGRVDPAANGHAALLGACEAGRPGIIARLLADPRLDPSVFLKPAPPSSAWGDSGDDSSLLAPLRAAVESGSVDAVDALAADDRFGLHGGGSGDVTAALVRAAPFILLAAVRCRRGPLVGGATLAHLLSRFPTWAHPSAGGNAALLGALHRHGEDADYVKHAAARAQAAAAAAAASADGAPAAAAAAAAAESGPAHTCLDVLLAHPALDLSDDACLSAIGEHAHGAQPSALSRVLAHPSVPPAKRALAARAACRNAAVYYRLGHVWRWLHDPTGPFAGDAAGRATAELQCLAWQGAGAYATKGDDDDDDSGGGSGADAASAPAGETQLKGGVDKAAALLAAGADPGADGSEALVLASAQGDVPLMRLLLAHPHTDPAAQGGEALVRAAGCGGRNLPAVQLLLSDARVDPTARNCAAYRYVQRFDNERGNAELKAALLGHASMAPLIAAAGGLEAFKAAMLSAGDEADGGGDGVDGDGNAPASPPALLPHEAAAFGAGAAAASWLRTVQRAVYSDS